MKRPWYTSGLAVALVAVSILSGAAVPGRPDRSAIVFGYMQQNAVPLQSDQYRYHVFTHIAPPPVGFNSSGNFPDLTGWNNRVADLKPGDGAVSNLGVKVICDIINSGFDVSIVNTVMPSASLRTQLVSNIVALVSNQWTGCDGVALDLEYGGTVWTEEARDGINVFCQQLNTALKALNPPRELFFYVYPAYSSARYNLTGGAGVPSLIDNIDYLLFSAYEDSSGNYMTAVAQYPSVIARADGFMTRGVPAEKFVMTLPLYGRNWDTNNPVFNSWDGVNRRSVSWTSATVETKYQQPPFTKYTDTEMWANYYYYPSRNGIRLYQLTSFDDAFTAELKMRLAKVWKGSVSGGGQLAGVGFWSLIWPAQGIWPYSWDPNTGAVSTGLRRTHSAPYTVMEEVFAPAGTRVFRAEPFEALVVNPNWVSPTDGPDDVHLQLASVSSIPAPAGGRAGSHRAAQIQFTFNGSGNRLFFKFRVLGTPEPPRVIDYDSALIMVDYTTKLSADVFVPTALAGTEMRMVVSDHLHQLEKGPATSLSSVGWKHIEWDLTNAAYVTAYLTAEAAYSSGNGIINYMTPFSRDITFAGFEVTASSSLTNAQVVFDNIEYTNAYHGGKHYVINEFRYADPAQQFVEVYGPSGVMPSGLELRFMDSSSGAVASFVSLGGSSIPDDTGNGFGYFVVGASGGDQYIVPGSIPASTPGAMQLYDTVTRSIHDAVVYKAFSTRGSLDSPANPIVTDNGPGWMGVVADGRTNSGVAYTVGRYPDGADSGINAKDFSMMSATPGAGNGNSVALPVTYDFSAAPAAAFRTSPGNFSVENVAGGMPPSPSGGMVHRCVSTAGGGSQSVIGDPAFGAGPNGYSVAGEVFLQGATAPAQACGVGICARTGSDFFNSAPADSGYDSGFWLIYENAAGVGLADGQADHPGVVQFVYATNDGQDGSPSMLLASKTLAELGVSAGQWTTFRLAVNPNATGDKLVAELNGMAIYSGPIPAGAPPTGAFQVGFRENHDGAPGGTEGTWIDNIAISPFASAPMQISGTVLCKGAGVPNVDIQGAPTPTMTDASGAFSFLVPSGWSGTLQPRKPGYVFSPATYTLSNVTTPQSNMDFTASYKAEVLMTDSFVVRGTWQYSGDGRIGPDGMEHDYDASGEALRLRVFQSDVLPDGTAKRARMGGWYTTESGDWLPYSAVGSENYIRAKFYVYATGQANPAARNQIPVFSCRVSDRFAATANLEVAPHINDLPAIENTILELAPSTNSLMPSIYRVDYDVPDVPYFSSHPEEGIWRSFAAVCTDAQDNGYLVLTESCIAIYPAVALADAPENLRKTYTAAGGDLERYAGLSSRYNVWFAPDTTEGGRPALSDTTSTQRIRINVDTTGAAFDSSSVPTDWVGIATHYLSPTRNGALSRTQIPRVAPGRQYKMRFHLAGTQQSNRQPPFWMYAHTMGFGWGMKFELSGAYAVDGNDPTNQLAWQIMPGTGTQVSDGWYNVLMITPMHPDIRPEFTGGEPIEQRMPLSTSQPGYGEDADSLRDLGSGVIMIDTLNFGSNAVLESGNIKLDAVEVREYDIVPD